jgi:hypothetical protein
MVPGKERKKSPEKNFGFAELLENARLPFAKGLGDAAFP